MASALLALANPVYQGLKHEREVMKRDPETRTGSRILHGFKAFGEGFIGGGGAQAVGGAIASKREGGRVSMAGVGGTGVIVGNNASVLGGLPGVAFRREAFRASHDARNFAAY
jgi:hypothetical protein|tara:strand:- start:1199 stop:1537 length:339 start_codon:yes stop_codon:yes gene_type:complete